ncbi:hypothetical protein PhCBS80983_g00832 [Powellomyces hirtus]|uniref:Endonuclease/exonuclease/phosphatase domain-containing protein n=1 Tax=Powellomyces hirtus TaxID=109895 RepID=A0A507EFB9_9FUNG|nr:hypothetical protein PhCBS80983_g00832 [Powellomyces hirtus]
MAADRTFKLVSFNIYNGGIDPDTTPETAATSARMHQISSFLLHQNADMIALTELNHWTACTLASAAAGWGHAHTAMMETTNTAFRMGITSKWPMSRIERVAEGFWHGMLCVRAHVDCDGLKDMNVVVTHMNPMSAQERKKEASAIGEFIRSRTLQDNGDCWIVTGDLNSLSRNDERFYHQTGITSLFKGNVKLTRKFLTSDGDVEYGVLTQLESFGLSDLSSSHQAIDYSVPTALDVDDMHAVKMRLDYAFGNSTIRDRFKCTAAIVRTDETALLSDHYPLLLTVSVP